jgi:intracellular multiplication protein IcmN
MKKSYIVVFFIILMSVSGCASTSAKPATTSVSAAISDPDQSVTRAKALASLKRNGVQVIHVGEQYRLVFRDDFMFEPHSANLLPMGKAVLGEAAMFIRSFTTESVQVTAYTDNQDPVVLANAMTTRQAQVVAKHLWQYGVDTRLMSSLGLGRANPVDWNGTLQGQSHNRRVEVSFRYYPMYQSYE